MSESVISAHLRHLTKRLACRWLGCHVTEHPGCDRCGECYGPDFVERGIWPRFWWPIVRFWTRFVRPPKCRVCGERMFLTKDGYFDCLTNDDDHMPF